MDPPTPTRIRLYSGPGEAHEVFKLIGRFSTQQIVKSLPHLSTHLNRSPSWKISGAVLQAQCLIPITKAFLIVSPNSYITDNPHSPAHLVADGNFDTREFPELAHFSIWLKQHVDKGEYAVSVE